MTVNTLRKRISQSLLEYWCARWREIRGRAPSARQRELLEHELRRALRRGTTMRVAEAEPQQNVLREVFPLGLPELDLLQQISEPSMRAVTATRRRLGLMGEAPVFEKAISMAACFAASSAPVLIQGETGSGKELVAQLIHALSERAQHPWVTLSCAAVSETLMMSELFGYEPGAFTGAALRGRLGKVEAANGGTLFLDEIGELPLAAQAALLRFVDTGEIQKVGRARSHRVSVRLVAATHRNLEAMVKAGTFRADLYYRIALLAVELPPLRQRRKDIPLLIEYFMHELQREHLRSHPLMISAAALRRLNSYDWPGNILELKFTLARSFLLARDRPIDLEHLGATLAATNSAHEFAPDATPLRALLMSIRAPLFRDHERWIMFLVTHAGTEFTNHDACATFAYSDSAARIRLAALVSRGVLIATGSNKGRRYRLNPDLLSA
jgi:transcriptional regulator with PAS, ATPase and Fis domain